MGFFDRGYIRRLDYDNLPALVPAGGSREQILGDIVDKWCKLFDVVHNPAQPIRGAVDRHVQAGGYVLEGVALWDETVAGETDGRRGAPVDLGDLLRMVEQRPGLYILLRGCRVYKCHVEALRIRPRFVSYGVRFDSTSFESATFGDAACFERATFGDSASFDFATFGSSANFEFATFGESASFRSARFGASATFLKATFGDAARFDGATFGDAASFSRATVGDSASFGGATFADSASFFGAKFGDFASFESATFGDSASFFGTKFGNSARFQSATYGDSARFSFAAYGDSANFLDVAFGASARFGRATFGASASLEHSTFGLGGSLRHADLNRADLSEANLSGCDLRDVRGLVLDDTRIRDAQFSPRSDDPWSVLRRAYTGPRLIFNLLFLIAFFLPYVARTGYWVGVNRAELAAARTLADLRDHAADARGDQTEPAVVRERALEAIARRLPGPENPQSRQSRVWRVVLGVDRGTWFWISAVLLLGYNVLRAGLTWFVAPMRDEEERSGVAPAYRATRLNESYGWLTWPHHVAKWLGRVAFVLAAWNAWHWLTLDVWLPGAGNGGP